MEEIYNKLNGYLNEICNYLRKSNSFLLDNIKGIAMLNDDFLEHIDKYDLDNRVVQNKLTYEDVFLLAREIVESIDECYLSEFDNLII